MTSERSGARGRRPPDEEATGPAPRVARRPLWQEALVVAVVAVGAALLVKSLLLQAFYIPSESMEPGLVRNDRILVQKISYELGGSPQRGDVVVFEDPGDWLPPDEAAGPTGTVAKAMEKVGLYPSGGHLVKRVIGIAGDSIHCCDPQGRIMVNRVALDEQGYAREDGATCYGPMHDCTWDAGPVPEGSIFVMGDNRSHSADSSYHLCEPADPHCTPGDEYVRVDQVVGKVFVLMWPWQHFTWLHRPDSFAGVPPPARPGG
ncbi:signal peptidase I [Nocardioides agariphilus]|uniref:signal peptidase I n=1 Tax=Nocardioides agariphilus TaxID=433664 RepID=UPI003520114A